MEIMSELPSLNNSVVGLGFFDGVHIGHCILIKKVVELSNMLSIPSVIITFKKSPAEKFVKDVKYLTTNTEKRKILNGFNIDYLIELPFNKKIMNTSAYDFVKFYLKAKLNAQYIVTGFNFTFGKDRIGNAGTLKSLSNEFGYTYYEIEPIKYNNKVVSSTHIKELAESGDIETANKLLTQPLRISGKVIEGKKLGRKIGFPTANIIYDKNKVKIPFGVYKVEVIHAKKLYKGIMNYGIRPTINKDNKDSFAEINIFNFDKNIYNRKIEVKIIKKIRSEMNFNSINELKSQIKKDIKLC